MLDPRSLELASSGGRERKGVADLPWATSIVHTPEFLIDGSHRHEVLTELATYASQRPITAVLAPTHLIERSDDAWIEVDDLLVSDLRSNLDRVGAGNVRIYRPVYLHSGLLRDAGFLHSLATRLRNSPADAVWLGVHPFGTSRSGPLALRRYVDACVALHSAGLPLIGMHTGTVGVLLMALGAISGIESGVTDLENFDQSQFGEMPKKDGKTIGATPRIYVSSLGVFMTQREAREFFSKRGMTSQHACQAGCCRRGVEDMYRYRINHFVTSRRAEVDRLSRTPPHLRPRVYLDEFLRPACDRAVAASRLFTSLNRTRRRLDDWRATVAGILDSNGGEVRSRAVPLSSQRATRSALR